MSEEWNTRKSLLQRMKNPMDEQAWSDFVAYYENFIYHILRQMQIDTEDCNDLIQEILIKLWKNLAQYDPQRGRFRTWLGQIVRNAAYDYFNDIKSRRALLDKEGQIAEIIKTTPASDVEKMVEEEWMLYMTSYALKRLHKIFSGEAINVFSLSLDGLPAKDIARQLNISIDSVYTLKNRVKSRLIKEVHALMIEVEYTHEES